MTEPTMNQFAPPQAHVADLAGGATSTGELKLFSAQGRIGRLRYIAYGCGASLVYIIVLSVLSVVFASNTMIATASTVVGVAAVFWFSTISAIKRLHDMNRSGWWSIAAFIPLVALVWMCVSGDKGENQYGAPPPPNTWGVRALACVMPLFFVLGILAAIAIPQYKNYTDRARAAQQQQAPSATP